MKLAPKDLWPSKHEPVFLDVNGCYVYAGDEKYDEAWQKWIERKAKRFGLI